MIRVTTESGAVYQIDGLKVLREGPPIADQVHLDDDWLTADHITDPKVGAPMMILWEGHRMRVTSPVTEVTR